MNANEIVHLTIKTITLLTTKFAKGTRILKLNFFDFYKKENQTRNTPLKGVTGKFLFRGEVSFQKGGHLGVKLICT